MKNILKYVLIFFMSYLLLLLTNPLFQVGNNTYNDYESVNYNGYFAVVDEDMLIDNGFTYSCEEVYVTGQPMKLNCSYRKTITYDNYTDYTIRRTLVGAYTIYCPVYSSGGSFVSGSLATNISMFGRSGTSIYGAGGWIVIDPTTNYRIDIYFMGVSNYE